MGISKLILLFSTLFFLPSQINCFVRGYTKPPWLRSYFFSLMIIFFISTYAVCSSNEDFNSWLKNFKNLAIKKGISKQTVNVVLKEAKFGQKFNFIESSILSRETQHTFGKVPFSDFFKV